MTLIATSRFRLRPLTADDATPRYCGWLDEESARRFISGAAERHDLASIRRYIADRSGRDDVLFLGIFTREAGEHIGNIKYEPIDARCGYAVMGILIGEPAWRGKGVAVEVIGASAEWLARNRAVLEVVLGVSDDNPGAIRAYEKTGFVRESSPFFPGEPPPHTFVMVRRAAGARRAG